MASARRMTAAEFARYPDRKLYELVDGRLADRPGGALAGYTAGQLMFRLAEYVKATVPDFVLCSGLGCVCFPGRPDLVRWAGTAGYRLHRLSADDWHAEFCPVPPDLVVKPVFPGEPAAETAARVGEWLAAGTSLVLVVDPDDQTATAYRPGGAVRVFAEADTLPGDPVLPGFACPVADLFRLPAGRP